MVTLNKLIVAQGQRLCKLGRPESQQTALLEILKRLAYEDLNAPKAEESLRSKIDQAESSLVETLCWQGLAF